MLWEQVPYLRKSYANVADYQARKTHWDSFVSTVSGRRLLSTYPDVTALSMTPEIPDPFFNSTLELRGQWNSGPVVAEINTSVYDLIVIAPGEAEAPRSNGYRGVGYLGRRDVVGSEENLLARMCIPGDGDLVAQSRLWRDPSQAFQVLAV